MAEKQAHLNGAYYGPSIPPSQSYHRHSGRRGCGCCGCLLSMLFKIIVTIVVVVGLAILVLWLVFRPNKVKFHVTDVSLSQFNFTNNDNMLHYNMSLNINIRNPNKRIGIYYDYIEVRALYQDKRFDTVWLTPFYQGHKTTSVLSPVFNGQQLILLGADEVSHFNSENSVGIYTVDVKLNLRVRFRIGKVKVGKFKPKVECDLKIPLDVNGRFVVPFETTKCDIDY